MSLAAVLAWFDENLRGGRSRLELRAASSRADLAAVAKVVDADLAPFGWSLHDGTELPVKKKRTIQGEPARAKVIWLPGGYRWLGAREALTWAQSKYNQTTPADYRSPPVRPRRLPFAASGQTFCASLAVELEGPRRGEVVFRRQSEPGTVVAPSLDAFFARYLEHLQAGRIAYEPKHALMRFEGGPVERAFVAAS